MKTVFFAAVDPSPDLNVGASRQFRFDDSWLWPVLILAALFVGYLCLDAWIGRQRQKRMDSWRERRK